jgi:drug/metabolite transporter (DMT)-like permease
MSSHVESREASQYLLWAIIGSILVNVASLLLFFAPADDDPPAAAVLIAFVSAVLALLGAWGLWQRRRWGWWVTLVITALTVFGAIPVFFIGPGTALLIGNLAAVVIGVGVIVLLLRRDAKALLT